MLGQLQKDMFVLCLASEAAVFSYGRCCTVLQKVLYVAAGRCCTVLLKVLYCAAEVAVFSCGSWCISLREVLYCAAEVGVFCCGKCCIWLGKVLYLAVASALSGCGRCSIWLRILCNCSHNKLTAASCWLDHQCGFTTLTTGAYCRGWCQLCCGRQCSCWAHPVRRYMRVMLSNQRQLPNLSDLKVTNHMNREAIQQVSHACFTNIVVRRHVWQQPSTLAGTLQTAEKYNTSANVLHSHYTDACVANNSASNHAVGEIYCGLSLDLVTQCICNADDRAPKPYYALPQLSMYACLSAMFPVCCR